MLGDPESGLVVGRLHDDLWVPGSTPAEEMPASRRRLEWARVTRLACMAGQRADRGEQRSSAHALAMTSGTAVAEAQQRLLFTVCRLDGDAAGPRRWARSAPGGTSRSAQVCFNATGPRHVCVAETTKPLRRRRGAGDSPPCCSVLFWMDGEPSRVCGASPVSARWSFDDGERSQGRRVSVSTAHGAWSMEWVNGSAPGRDRGVAGRGRPAATSRSPRRHGRSDWLFSTKLPPGNETQRWPGPLFPRDCSVRRRCC